MNGVRIISAEVDTSKPYGKITGRRVSLEALCECRLCNHGGGDAQEPVADPSVLHSHGNFQEKSDKAHGAFPQTRAEHRREELRFDHPRTGKAPRFGESW